MVKEVRERDTRKMEGSNYKRLKSWGRSSERRTDLRGTRFERYGPVKGGGKVKQERKE